MVISQKSPKNEGIREQEWGRAVERREEKIERGKGNVRSKDKVGKRKKKEKWTKRRRRRRRRRSGSGSGRGP